MAQAGEQTVEVWETFYGAMHICIHGTVKGLQHCN